MASIHKHRLRPARRKMISPLTSLSFTLLILTSSLHILAASAPSSSSSSLPQDPQELTTLFQNTYTHSEAYSKALRLLDSLLLHPPSPPTTTTTTKQRHGKNSPDSSTPDHLHTQKRTEYHSAHWDAFSTWGPLGTVLRLAVATRNTLKDWAASSKAASGADAAAFIPQARSQEHSSVNNPEAGDDPLIYHTTNGSRPLQLWPWWEGRADSAIAGPWIVPELESEQLAGNSVLSPLSSPPIPPTVRKTSSSSFGILSKLRTKRAARARKGASSSSTSSSTTGKKLTPLENAQRRRNEAVALLEWVSFGEVGPDYELLIYMYRQQQQQHQPLSTSKHDTLRIRQAQQDALNAALNRNRTHIAHRVPVHIQSTDDQERDHNRTRSAALWTLAEHSLWGTHAASPHLPRAYAAYQGLATDYGNGTAHARLGFLEGSGWGRIGGPGVGSASVPSSSSSKSARAQSWGVGFQGIQIGEESEAEEGLRQARALLHYTIAASSPKPSVPQNPLALPDRSTEYSTQTSAQMALAYRHFSGIGTPMDCLQALPWYEIVAQDVHARFMDGPPGGLTIPYSHPRLSDVEGGAFGPGASAASSGYAARRMHMKAVLESRAGSGAAGDEARIRDLLEYYEYQAEPVLKIPSHLMSEGQRKREASRGRRSGKGKGSSSGGGGGAGGMLSRSGLGRRLGFGGAPQGELTGMGGGGGGGSSRSSANAALYALELARFYYGGSLWLAGESAGKVERDYVRAMDYALRVAHRVWPFDADQVRRGGASGPDPRLTKKQQASGGQGGTSGSSSGGAGGIPDVRDPSRRPGDPPVQQLLDYEDFKLPTKSDSDIVLAGRAAAMLGWMFLRGEGAPQSYHNAWVWFSRGSEAGDTDCHNGLGVMIRDGLGVKPSPKDATQYFTAAAQPVGAIPEGLINMGRLYTGVKDYGNAARMFQTAKSLQDPFEAFLWHGKIDALITHAQEVSSSSSDQPLSSHSTSGPTLQERCDSAVINLKHAVERADWADPIYHRADRAWKRGDSQRALLGWMLAGEMGYEPAQNNVAWILDRDKHRLQIPALDRATDDSFDRLALVQWTRSAGQENVDALVKMGDYYFRGIGTPTPGLPAYEKAVACYSAAADMSASALAYWNMGWMYEMGLGVGGGRDFHIAKRYYDMAWATNKKEAYLAVFLSLVKLHVRAAWAALYHRDASALAMFESYARGLDMSMPLTEDEEEKMKKSKSTSTSSNGDQSKKEQQGQQKKKGGPADPEDEPGAGDMHIPETYDRRTPAERIQDPQVQQRGARAPQDGWLGNDEAGGYRYQDHDGAGGAEEDDGVVVFELDLFEDFEGLLLLGAIGFLGFLVWYRRRIQHVAGEPGGAGAAAAAAALTPEERERRERIEAARREFRARGEDVPPGPDEIMAQLAAGAPLLGADQEEEEEEEEEANGQEGDDDENEGGIRRRRRRAGQPGEAGLEDDREEADPEWFANAM